MVTVKGSTLILRQFLAGTIPCRRLLGVGKACSRVVSSSSEVPSIPPVGCFLVDVFSVLYLLLWSLICCFSFRLYSTPSSPSSTCLVELLEALAVRAAPLPCFVGGYDFGAQPFAFGLTFLLGVLSGIWIYTWHSKRRIDERIQMEKHLYCRRV